MTYIVIQIAKNTLVARTKRWITQRNHTVRAKGGLLYLAGQIPTPPKGQSHSHLYNVLSQQSHTWPACPTTGGSIFASAVVNVRFLFFSLQTRGFWIIYTQLILHGFEPRTWTSREPLKNKK